MGPSVSAAASRPHSLVNSDGVSAAQMRSTRGLEVQTCLCAADDFLVFIFVVVSEHIICLCTHCVQHPLCVAPQRQISCVPGLRIMSLFVALFILADTFTFTGLILFQ